jgi:hypothetical protein
VVLLAVAVPLTVAVVQPDAYGGVIQELLTVSFQWVRAAPANPVKSLRPEQVPAPCRTGGKETDQLLWLERYRHCPLSYKWCSKEDSVFGGSGLKNDAGTGFWPPPAFGKAFVQQKLK